MLYIDGSLVATGCDDIYIPDPNTTLQIGIAECCTRPRHFNGLIDDIRLYNRALSDDEIWQLYTGCGDVDYNLDGKINMKDAQAKKSDLLEQAKQEAMIKYNDWYQNCYLEEVDEL